MRNDKTETTHRKNSRALLAYISVSLLKVKEDIAALELKRQQTKRARKALEKKNAALKERLRAYVPDEVIELACRRAVEEAGQLWETRAEAASVGWARCVPCYEE